MIEDAVRDRLAVGQVFSHRLALRLSRDVGVARTTSPYHTGVAL